MDGVFYNERKVIINKFEVKVRQNFILKNIKQEHINNIRSIQLKTIEKSKMGYIKNLWREHELPRINHW